ncbi:Nima interactive protein [Pleurostoma richardsiae]|uniref:Nima interactive protein n=1 Tax=Pleurostoma richardsiae TaxID=41990 RepID=A0AA38VPH2_9PEZI|nr:Nima interactive protein [Pleurostoma richardsiae]
MIDSENLRTASLYINNQLLSRGLLRDGQVIDFADPGKGAGLAATMGKIMGVVNDLILRRDRDAEHRESLSTTLRNLRAESLRQTDDIQRLQEKHAEAQRKAHLAEAAETALRAQLKAAEAGAHKLKEEAARTKRLVAETRAACANEVRKRDRQVDALKKAVSEAGRARGERKSPNITSITVTGEVGGDAGGSDSGVGMAMSVSNEAYDLRQETNAFLAELARGLSEENETLLALVRRTAQRLKEMSGWEREDGAGIAQGDGHAVPLTVSCEDVTNEIEAIIEHLRTILTNPSFVPIEEVVEREDEINRLRDGWEKMESRWKEAVHLIDGWRRRMAVSGRPVNMEELKMGLRLSPVRVRDVEETSHGLGLRLSTLQEEEDEQSINVRQSPTPPGSLHLVPAPEYEMEIEEDDLSDSSSIFQDDVEIDELDVSEPNVQILQQSATTIDSPPLPPRPELSPLKDSYSAGNRRPTQSRKRPGDFTTIIEEKTWEIHAAEAAPPPPPHTTKPQQSPQKRMKPSHQEAQEPLQASFSDSESSLDSILVVKAAERSAPRASEKTTRATRAKQQERPQSTPSRQPAHQRSRSPAVKSRKTPEESKAVATSASSTDMAPPPRPTPVATAAGTSTASNNSTTSQDRDTAQQRSNSPRKVTGPSRLPLPRTTNPLPPPQQSPLTMATIAAKLAASEREADAARVRAKLKAARLGGGKRVPLASGPSSRACSGEEQQQREPVPPAGGDPVKRDLSTSRESRDENGRDGGASVSAEEGGYSRGSGAAAGSSVEGQEPSQKPRKRERRASKVASRRRSTLNPWELQSLIEGNVAPASPA